MTKTKLSIVIHTEEEFDWNGGFKSQNNQVNHAEQLLDVCTGMFNEGYKVTFTLDYAFVNSVGGKNFIDAIKAGFKQQTEWGAHLHPWVNPPFKDYPGDVTPEQDSFPGNLPAEEEYDKLSCLTEKVSNAIGIKPVVYLAGRYGIGPNTHKTLKDLGYKFDLSITPFTDYSPIKGPDFSEYNNRAFENEGIKSIPHTMGYISIFPVFSDWLNRSAENLPKLNKSFIGKVILRLLGVKKVRLSPEGYSAKEMVKLAKSMQRIGIEHLIYSFHSSSCMIGGSPYSSESSSHTRFVSENISALQLLRKFCQPSKICE